MIHITADNLIVWLLISLLVGILGELLARRRAPDGIIGAIIVGFVAIFLVVGVFNIHIANEPELAGVPIITPTIVAALLVALWSSFAYHRVYRRGYDSYYRRGSYVRRPRRHFGPL